MLQERWDPTFSEASFGFRPGRSAHQAVGRAQEHLREGYRWVVDMDLEKFFDRVNHDKLMGEVRKRVWDRRVVQLIHRYLKSRCSDGDVHCTKRRRNPARWPTLAACWRICCWMSWIGNWKDEAIGLCAMQTTVTSTSRSQQAGERVMESVTRFLSSGFKLKVNEAKSAVGRPWERTFLGFTFDRRLRRKVSPKALKALKERVREMTGRTRGRRTAGDHRRPAQIPGRLEGVFRLCRGALRVEGTGLLDQAAAALLPLEAMGPPGLPGAAEARGQPGSGVEHGQIGPRSLASEPKSGAGVCSAGTVLCSSGIAETVRETDLISRTAVVRDPYARWCGRREAARPLPIPIRRALTTHYPAPPHHPRGSLMAKTRSKTTTPQPT